LGIEVRLGTEHLELSAETFRPGCGGWTCRASGGQADWPGDAETAAGARAATIVRARPVPPTSDLGCSRTPAALVHETATTQPRTLGLMPAVLFANVPTEPQAAVAALGLDPEQVGHVRGGALQADLDLPDGSWRLWPERGIAAWLGRHAEATPPPTASDLQRGDVDLLAGLDRLLDRGLWCSELRLLDDDSGWSVALPLRTALEALIEDGARIRGLSGVFSDGHGGASRVELFTDGEAWASTPLEAERWLLIASGIVDE
jgi:hypothetical protein